MPTDAFPSGRKRTTRYTYKNGAYYDAGSKMSEEYVDWSIARFRQKIKTNTETNTEEPFASMAKRANALMQQDLDELESLRRANKKTAPPVTKKPVVKPKLNHYAE